MADRGVRKNVKRLEAKIRADKSTGKLAKVAEDAPVQQSSWGLDFLFGGGGGGGGETSGQGNNSNNRRGDVYAKRDADRSSLRSDWDLNDDKRWGSASRLPLTHSCKAPGFNP
jgi:hypothetical protein